MARILVIDDSRSVLQQVEQMLLEDGHEVAAVGGGLEGAALLQARPFDLLLTDIYMPEEDGIQTIRTCRRTCPSVRIIAMSSRGGSWDMLRAARIMGADTTISKPFTREQLLATVAETLRRQKAPHILST